MKNVKHIAITCFLLGGGAILGWEYDMIILMISIVVFGIYNIVRSARIEEEIDNLNGTIAYKEKVLESYTNSLNNAIEGYDKLYKSHMDLHDEYAQVIKDHMKRLKVYIETENSFGNFIESLKISNKTSMELIEEIKESIRNASLSPLKLELVQKNLTSIINYYIELSKSEPLNLVYKEKFHMALFLRQCIDENLEITGIDNRLFTGGYRNPLGEGSYERGYSANKVTKLEDDEL